ncbi:MAG: carbohydrate-binding protein, partial [Planctomycetota bacterium]
VIGHERTGGEFHIESFENGVGTDLAGPIEVPTTGSWDNYVTVSTEIELEAGEQMLRIRMSDRGTWGYVGNFDRFSLVPVNTELPSRGGDDRLVQSPYAGRTDLSAARIEAEHYDVNGWVDLDNTNQGGELRNDGTDIQTGGTNHNVGWIKAGESLGYTFVAEGDAKFDLALRVASRGTGGEFAIVIDGVEQGRFSIDDTGGWQEYVEVFVGVNVTEGRHVLEVRALTAGPNGYSGNIDFLEFRASGAVDISDDDDKDADDDDSNYDDSNAGNDAGDDDNSDNGDFTPPPAPIQVGEVDPVTGFVIPGPDNTGPTNTDILVASSGVLEVYEDNAVIENLDHNGIIKVFGDNVTIRNSRITIPDGSSYAVKTFGGSATIEYTEITGDQASNAIVGADWVSRYNHIHHMGADAFRPYSRNVIEFNWVHDLGLAGEHVHADAIQSLGGSDIVVRGNYLDLTTRAGAGIIWNLYDGKKCSHWLIEGNWFGGASRNLNADDRGIVADTITIRNNYFMKGNYNDRADEGVNWSGNVNAETGKLMDRKGRDYGESLFPTIDI